MNYRTALLLIVASSLSAADFQTGQAARAVLGQSSFSAHERGLAPISLAIAKGRLYVADAANRVLAYDLSKIPDAREDESDRSSGGCPVCGFSPLATADQTVIPGGAAVSVYGKTVAIADTAKHRILIWRDASAPRINGEPDLILGRAAIANGFSGATLIDPVAVTYDGKRLYVGDAGAHRILIWNSLPASDDQAADAVLGQPDFQSANANDEVSAASVGVPAALASDGTNLFVADASSHRIVVFTAADGPLSDSGIMNSARLQSGPLAPGTLVTVEGSGLSEKQEQVESDGSVSLPKKLGGTEIIFNGQALALSAVSDTQVQVQLPYDVGSGTSASLFVRTEHGNGTVTITSAANVKLSSASPGLFALGGNEPRPGILLHAPAEENASEGAALLTAEMPGKPGEIVTVWATGLGLVSENGNGVTAVAGVPYEGPASAVLQTISARVNDAYAEVVSAELPKGAVGVYEVKVRLPEQLGLASAALTLFEAGAASNTISFPVQPAAR